MADVCYVLKVKSEVCEFVYFILVYKISLVPKTLDVVEDFIDISFLMPLFNLDDHIRLISRNRFSCAVKNLKFVTLGIDPAHFRKIGR